MLDHPSINSSSIDTASSPYKPFPFIMVIYYFAFYIYYSIDFWRVGEFWFIHQLTRRVMAVPVFLPAANKLVCSIVATMMKGTTCFKRLTQSENSIGVEFREINVYTYIGAPSSQRQLQYQTKLPWVDLHYWTTMACLNLTEPIAFLWSEWFRRLIFALFPYTLSLARWCMCCWRRLSCRYFLAWRAGRVQFCWSAITSWPCITTRSARIF